jgi:hypothetical protein
MSQLAQLPEEEHALAAEGINQRWRTNKPQKQPEAQRNGWAQSHRVDTGRWSSLRIVTRTRTPKRTARALLRESDDSQCQPGRVAQNAFASTVSSVR